MSLAPLLIGFLAIIVPGVSLSWALLRKTKMGLFEIVTVGFIFGLVFPPTMIWLEAYLIPYAHFFSFSAGLYNVNVIVLTIIGLVLSAWQGTVSLSSFRRLFSEKQGSDNLVSAKAGYKDRIGELRGKMELQERDMTMVREHERSEETLTKRHEEEISALKAKGAGNEEVESIQQSHRDEERRLMEENEAEERRLLRGDSGKTQNKHAWVWIVILALMLTTFATRIINISVAPKFFEFDPYFDMISTEYILTYGYQLLHDHSAWPTIIAGSPHRMQPIVPYLEAYWYQLATGNTTAFNTGLLSTVSSIYPPLVAALLVFVIFEYVYYEYGEFPALVAAALGTAMPALITTFIAGEQLLEPWGIFTLFWFFAAYLLAVKNPDEPRYAILAGIAFASTFLGAHYYTVDAGVLAAYILVQGIIEVFRRKDMRGFYKTNGIILVVITLFFLPTVPYEASLVNGLTAQLLPSYQSKA